MNYIQKMEQAANQAIADRVFPGCVVGVVNKDGDRLVLPIGNLTYESESPPVKTDTVYDVASVTKSIPTGCLALQLVDEGALNLTDKLSDYVPEFKNSDRDKVLIKHLLTYTLDGYSFVTTARATKKLNIEELTADDLLDTLFTYDFTARPGTTFKYTNIPATLLGLVIERVTDQKLDQLAEDRFFKPLQMERSTFAPQKFDSDEVAPTEYDKWRGLVHRVVHDESAYIFKEAGMVMGHAGLFSTAPDILQFLEMLLHDGKHKGKKYFSAEILQQMSENQIPTLGETTGLGWELFQPRYMGQYCGPQTFGKTGFTGTVCVCDRSKGLAYVILSNRTFPERSADSSGINTFRAQIGDIILGLA